MFSKEGEFFYDIGSEKFGDGYLSKFFGLVIDRFNNFLVCDGGNSDLKVFILDGKFVNKIILDNWVFEYRDFVFLIFFFRDYLYYRDCVFKYLCFVMLLSNGKLLFIVDSVKNCVFKFL